MSNGRISDQLRYMTVRILTSKNETTNWTGAGTGFLYYFTKDDKTAPLLVTNKHVVEGAVSIGLTFHVTADNNETPLPGSGRLISFPANQVPIIRHPDPNVDLAAIAIAPIHDYAINKEGWQPFIKCLDKTHLPSAQMMADFGSLEDIVMVGYPTGIVDAVNNFRSFVAASLRRHIRQTTKGNVSFSPTFPFMGDRPVRLFSL